MLESGQSEKEVHSAVFFLPASFSNIFFPFFYTFIVAILSIRFGY